MVIEWLPSRYPKELFRCFIGRGLNRIGVSDTEEEYLCFLQRRFVVPEKFLNVALQPVGKTDVRLPALKEVEREVNQKVIAALSDSHLDLRIVIGVFNEIERFRKGTKELPNIVCEIKFLDCGTASEIKIGLP